MGRSERKTPTPRATYRQRKSMFLVGKNPNDPGDDTDMEEVGVAMLVAARELAGVTYATTCPVVEPIAPVPAVCAATVPVIEYVELR